jgi:hypothetical protein
MSIDSAVTAVIADNVAIQRREPMVNRGTRADSIADFRDSFAAWPTY